MTLPAHIARAQKAKRSVPTEHEEQVTLMRWAAIEQRRYPELVMLYAIANGGKRHQVVANKLRAEGVKAGVPDLHLPVPRGTYHGMFIEMKRRVGGQVSQEQRTWIDLLTNQRYKAVVCRGWEEARAAITAYLTLPAPELKGVA